MRCLKQELHKILLWRKPQPVTGQEMNGFYCCDKFRFKIQVRERTLDSKWHVYLPILSTAAAAFISRDFQRVVWRNGKYLWKSSKMAWACEPSSTNEFKNSRSHHSNATVQCCRQIICTLLSDVKRMHSYFRSSYPSINSTFYKSIFLDHPQHVN